MKKLFSLQDFQAFVCSVINDLENKKIDQIISFRLTPLSSTQATAMVDVILTNKKTKTIALRLEKREGKEIKVDHLVLKGDLLKNSSCTLGSLEFQGPKNQNNSFDPAVPILPSFWGGG